MKDFNKNLVEEKIKKILERCKRPSWDEVANAINRYGYWEYEDYNELD